MDMGMPSNPIDQVLVNEGGGQMTNDPNDKGGRTQYGISEKSNPDAWKDGKVTEDEARAIYEQKYLVGTGIAKVADPLLQAQLLDFTVTSGPYPAISNLQTILGVKADGILGTGTLAALNGKDAKQVNNQLAQARIKMICRIVQKDPTQVKYLLGWINRACEFLV